ncbi:phosphopantetheine-binding protein [Andreprevotia lacus]|uniref:phosphopantetheine-binding protein n=1 Tax=Andreprevotia lacus TaxID=1121000 RepID=UPI000A01DA6E|nr:phosphopantetheine-binding protein [Andreprevotia lacus]
MLQQPAIRDAVVVARQDDEDTRLVAYLVAQPEQAMPDGDALRSILLRSLPDYMVPAYFIELAQLPLTPNGKVDRQALPAPQRQVDEDRYVAPRTATEARLAAIWAGVLKLDRVGVHDNFFALGGHSLLATVLTVQIRLAFACELNVRTVFEAPTVAALAEKLLASPDKTGADQGNSTPADGERNWLLVDDNIAKLDSPHTASHDIFFIPGAGGSAEVFNQVARSVPPDQANVFVFHHDGIDNEADPVDDFVVMAARYAPQILRHCSGKIVLAGYCVGGLIAYELAKALQKLGFDQVMLGFIDTGIVPAGYEFPPFDEAYFKSEFFKAICDTYSKVGEPLTARTFDNMPLENCINLATSRMNLHSPHEQEIWHTILRQRYLAEKYHAHAMRQYWADHPVQTCPFGVSADFHMSPLAARRMESTEIHGDNHWGNTAFANSPIEVFEGRHLDILRHHPAGVAKSLIALITSSAQQSLEDAAA